MTMGMGGILAMYRQKSMRAKLLEEENKQLKSSLQTAIQQLEGIELRFAERAALVSVVRDGRTIRFGFLRNHEVHYVQCMATWDVDIDAVRKLLLEPLSS